MDDMSELFYKNEWLAIIETQEERLRFSKLDREDALHLGLEIAMLAKEAYKNAAAISIVQDGMCVFAYKMHGTGLENEWWMRRKLNVSLATGVSSLRAYLEIKNNMRDISWAGREKEYAACGGCFPIKDTQGILLGHVLVSGLPHQEDHQLIADAMARMLGVNIPKVE